MIVCDVFFVGFGIRMMSAKLDSLDLIEILISIKIFFYLIDAFSMKKYKIDNDCQSYFTYPSNRKRSHLKNCPHFIIQAFGKLRWNALPNTSKR